MINESAWRSLIEELGAKDATLVAVSKTKSVEDIQALYALGQKDFGENYVQELAEKQARLPLDIRWHYIGHLQSNKVKLIAPFVYLIQGVDGFKLLMEINRQAAKADRVIDILLQMHISGEETKFGLDEKEIIELLQYYEAQESSLNNIRICGLMGMASNTEDELVIRRDFARLHALFLNLRKSTFLTRPYFSICSMGMSGDYRLAIQEGSNMVRIGSLLFGSR